MSFVDYPKRAAPTTGIALVILLAVVFVAVRPARGVARAPSRRG